MKGRKMWLMFQGSRMALSAALVFAAVAAVPAPGSATMPEGATWHQEWFPSQDGTMLRADVMLPEGRSPRARHPVILAIGPYFGRNPGNGVLGGPGVGDEGPNLRFNDLLTEGRVFERGYAYVQVDSRGYGGSGGCNDFGGGGEQMDTEAAVNWAASQPWSNGNVGMWGKSYDAWTEVMALAENPAPLKATVIMEPLIGAYQAYFLNGVHYDAGWYVTPTLYTMLDLAPTTASDATAEDYLYPAAGTATDPTCYVENSVMEVQPDRSLPYWRERDITARARRSRVPVFWVHGFNDANTKPDNFLPVFTHLEGTTRAWVGQWDHVRGNESTLVGRGGFMTEAMEWFDHYLKGAPMPERPAIRVQDGQGSWRTEDQWPPLDARPSRFGLATGSYTEGPTTPAVLGLPSQAWSVTKPAPHAAHVSGVPRLKVRYTASVPLSNLVAELYDVWPSGRARLMSRGAYRLPDTAGIVRLDMYPQDWRIERGHRLAVRFRRTGDWFTPTSTAGTVSITGGSIAVPFLRVRRGTDGSGGPAAAMRDVPELTLYSDTIAHDRARGSWPAPLQRPGANP